jgi:hypothetical protein
MSDREPISRRAVGLIAALRAATEMVAPNEFGAAGGTPGRNDLLAPDSFRHFFEG